MATARRSCRVLVHALAMLTAAGTFGLPAPPAAGGDAPWRSALYPENWTPDRTAADGGFLHDFSYAGYRAGEASLPTAVAGVVIDAIGDHGADPSGATDATAALQSALDTAVVAGGGTVQIGAGTFRIDDLLEVRGSGVVVRGAGRDETLLHFTRGAAMTGRSGLTFRGTVVQGADLPLVADAAERAARVQVADATSLTVGDHVAVGWVITDEFVTAHGMTGTWQAFNGTWRTMFRRSVLAIDTTAEPHVVTLDAPLRYASLVRDAASLRRESGYLTECGLESLSVTNAVERSVAWESDRAHVVEWNGVADCWMQDVHSAAPPPAAPGGDHLQSGGVLVVSSKRVTVADCSMQRAQNRGGGGNGYLFEISRATDVLLRDCSAADGRHNFIQNWDFGTTGCVFLRCVSRRSRAYFADWDPIGYPAYSEFHHSLSMANLIDGCRLEDGWTAANRGAESSGAGHTATACVFWNLTGGGLLRSFQYGRGYVIGPGDMTVLNTLGLPNTAATEPEDQVERGSDGRALEPVSLYEDQLARRIGDTSPSVRIRRGGLTDDDRPDRDRVTLLATVAAAAGAPLSPAFDPATQTLEVTLDGPDWAFTVTVPAGAPAWRGRRVLKWRSDGAARPRVRIRYEPARGRLQIRATRVEFASSPQNPVATTVSLGPVVAVAHAFWRQPRKQGRHDVARLRMR